MKLAPRQTEVLERLAAGKPDKQIARELNISLSTVKNTNRRIYELLGVANRTQAAILVSKQSPSFPL